jgi:hypothetical protein
LIDALELLGELVDPGLELDDLLGQLATASRIAEQQLELADPRRPIRHDSALRSW